MYVSNNGVVAQNKGRREKGPAVTNSVQCGKNANLPNPAERQQKTNKKESHKGTGLANNKRARNESDQAMDQLIRNAYKSMSHLKDPSAIVATQPQQHKAGPAHVSLAVATHSNNINSQLTKQGPDATSGQWCQEWCQYGRQYGCDGHSS